MDRRRVHRPADDDETMTSAFTHRAACLDVAPLIVDTSIAGETKADGVVPAHPGGGALRVSEDKWIIFFATLDTRGWDANRSIIYQLRRGAPDGKLIVEGAIERCRDNWQPLEPDMKLFKSCGMPIAFGVPKGAIINNQPAVNANRFVVKWYRWAHMPGDGRLMHPNHHSANWPRGLSVRDHTLRIEWMQFRLRDDELDIDVLAEPTMLRQRGYESGDAFCELGPNYFTNHAMVPPSPTDDSHMHWLDCHTFVPYGNGPVEHGSIATVRFSFNIARDRYEWTRTGPLTHVPGRVIGEASVVRRDDHWLIAARSFTHDGATCWFKTSDPFAPLPEPAITPTAPPPRTVFRSGSGAVWLFGNAPSPRGDRRRLCAWRLDEQRMRLTDETIVADAKQLGLPMYRPMLDMAKLCPPIPGRSDELLLFRAITRRQTADQDLDHDISEAEQAQAGIYAARLDLGHDASDPWRFEPNAGAST
jgi:hypothetical protein